MKIVLIQVLLPLATYFIGVLIGMRVMYRRFIDKNGTLWIPEEYLQGNYNDLVDPEEIQHVGYTAEQCGYDK